MKNNTEDLQEREQTSCGNEFPHFGASYPDAGCIDGRLWDLDSSGDDNMLYNGGDDPCPWCNTKEYVQNMIDNEMPIDHIAAHLKFLGERYGNGIPILLPTP